METNRRISKEINAIANNQSLKMTRIIGIVLLLITFLGEVYYHYAVTAMILTLIYSILPTAIGGMITIKKQKQDILAQLKKKYQYQNNTMIGHQIVFLIMLLLLAIWGKVSLASTIQQAWIQYAPVVIFVVLLVSHFTYFIYYRIKLPLVVKNNRI